MRGEGGRGSMIYAGMKARKGNAVSPALEGPTQLLASVNSSSRDVAFVLNLTGSFAQITTVERCHFSSLPKLSLWNKPKYVNTGSMKTVSVWAEGKTWF
jgi:hypothetical protein